MMTENMHSNVEEFLAQGLGQRPTVSVIDTALPRRRMLNPFHWSGLAACLLAVIVFSSLYIPFLAKALASLPLVGKPYVEMIVGGKLNMAYELGYVDELNKVIYKPGAKITVIQSYSDPDNTVVTFKITLLDGDTRTLTEPNAMSVWLEGPRWVYFPGGKYSWGGGTASVTRYLENENAVSYSMSTDGLPWWWVGRLKLNVQAAGSTWTMAIPVQRMRGERVQTVKVNKDFRLDTHAMRVKEVSFSPTQTTVTYSTWLEYTTPSTQYYFGESPHIVAMYDADDKLVKRLSVDSFTFVFPPTQSKEVTFVVESYRKGLEHVELPLAKGAVHQGKSMVSIEELDIMEDSIRVTYSYRAEEASIDIWHALLCDSSGKMVSQYVHSDNMVPGRTTKTFKHIRDIKDHESFVLKLTVEEVVECDIRFTVNRR